MTFVRNFGLSLHDVIQLGGHSNPRTHRIQGQPIGLTLVKTLLSEVEKRENIEVRVGAAVSRLCCDDVDDGEGVKQRRVTGVFYEEQSRESGENVEVKLDAGAVILTTGGAACDTEADGLMQEHAPDLVGMATSSGAQATGSGIKMGKCVSCLLREKIANFIILL